MIGHYKGNLRLALQNYFKISSNEKPIRDESFFNHLCGFSNGFRCHDKRTP
jgi:hypothetical protein